MLMMMMFIGTETLVTQLVYERSRMHADLTSEAKAPSPDLAL